MKSNKQSFQNILIGTGLNSRSEFGLSLFNLNTNQLDFIPTPSEPHDIVTSPKVSHLVCAFGRRPPIKESFIIDIKDKKIFHTFYAQENHAFYGHGIWNDQNEIISAEINLDSYESFYVYRNGDNPSEIIKTIPANGSAIHQIDQLIDDKIYVANNGDWYSKKNPLHRNLSVFHNDQIVDKYFFDLPTSFGLQHFIQIKNELFLAFREPPEQKDYNLHSPLISIDLVNKNIQSIELLPDTIRQLKAEGLSMAQGDNELLGMTSLKGKSILFYDTKNKSEKHLIKDLNASGITYHPHSKVFHVSCENGILCEINSITFDIKLLSHQFFAASHHSLI